MRVEESRKSRFESRDRIGITDTGKIPVLLGYCSITFDKTEMVRIPI